MKDISIYFQASTAAYNGNADTIGERIICHDANGFPTIEKKAVALIHCPEYRGGVEGATVAQQELEVLTQFGELSVGEAWSFNIYDLGVIRPGQTIEDTYFALAQVVSELVKHQVLPIVLGGSQDLTYALYQGYQVLEQLVNLTNIDKRFDLGEPEEPITPAGFVSKILMNRPCYLFNCSVIGVQLPYVKRSELDLFERLYFDVCRLGEFNADFKKAEPLLRNTDILGIDVLAIRKADLAVSGAGPNGFYADQICQIAKYAGLSDKLSSFGLFNLPSTGLKGAPAQLLAEIIWYFLDGFAQRKGDFPIGTKKDYTKFMVHLEGYTDDITFYKSPRSDRWWMEVPYPSSKETKYERQHIVPCNLEDYEAAMKNEMPDLWWKTYQKLT